MKRYLGNTWIGWLNILLVQFLFFRIYYSQETNGNITDYGILLPVLPLTGWCFTYIPFTPWKIYLLTQRAGE